LLLKPISMILFYTHYITYYQDSIAVNDAKQDNSHTNNNISLPESTAVPLRTTVKKNSTTILQQKQLRTEKSIVSVPVETVSDSSKLETAPDSVKQVKEHVNTFSYLIHADSFDYNYNNGVFIEKNILKATKEKELNAIPHQYYRSELNWTLIIGLISILLLLTIKTSYQKFLNQVISTLINSQLARKMFLEKNILIRRTFLLLNLNFIIILSLFFLLLAVTFEFEITNNHILDYLLILSGVIGIILIRYLMFYLTGILFNQLHAINEYIYNKYLFNKNIGLFLLPVVFTSVYVTPVISKILLVTSLCLLILITIIKIFRGFKIILKNGVLLFYTILYLCTLELLPLVLGSKLIIILR